MPTEKLLIFDEAGNAKRVKARLTRFLENEPVSDSDKSAIRSTLGITSNGGLGDLLAANNLDDVASAATSRTNLEVNSVAQDAESTGTKLVGPSMYFDGSAYVTIANDSKLSFEGSGDDLPFTFACWTKLPASSPVGTVFFSKWASAAEYSFQTTSSGNLNLYLSDGTNSPFIKASTALPTEQWVHVCGTYSGTSGGGYSSAANGLTLYVDGEAVTATKTNKAAYSGMTAGSDALQISRIATTNYEQTMRDARIFNKALSAAEVKTLCLSGSLPESFAESTGGAEIYSGDSSTFAGGLGNWTEEGGTSLTVTASTGEMVITNTSGATGGTKGARNLVDLVTEGKKLRLTFTSRCSSGTATGMTVKMFNGSQATSATKIQGSGTANTGSAAIYSFTPTGSNETHIIEFVLAGSATDKLYFNISADGTGEVYNFDNITLTQIGSVLDARAENYNQSANKLIDQTSNNFVGTGSGVTILSPRTHISAETLDLTNLPTSDSGLSAGEVYNASGTLKIKL
jgi:hypothetical protein